MASVLVILKKKKKCRWVVARMLRVCYKSEDFDGRFISNHDKRGNKMKRKQAVFETYKSTKTFYIFFSLDRL